MYAGTVIVPYSGGSDGDFTCRPNKSRYTLVDPPELYLEKLGTAWMTSLGQARDGIKYKLDKLPFGYELYEKARDKDIKHIDRWLYGHPSGKFFDSPNRFWPHFKHLMENDGNTIGCECIVCNGKSCKKAIPSLKPAAHLRTSATATKPALVSKAVRGRPPRLDLGKTDDEGTPDVYRNLIDKLKRDGQIDEPIEERMSLDWRAERDPLKTHLEQTSKQPSWIPRVGELVLVVRELSMQQEIRYVAEQDDFRIYDNAMATSKHRPAWEAAIIGQSTTENLSVQELIKEGSQSFSNVNYSGFRVELIPDPNQKDKRLSYQYKYVSLRQVRPFVLWAEYLKHIPQNELHETIRNAFKVMSTVSLLEKYRMKGKWPNAKIECKGIFIGSELLLINDFVRVLPTDPRQRLTEVIQIRCIILELSNLDKSSASDNDDGHPYNSTVGILGKAYTLRPQSHNISEGQLASLQSQKVSLPPQIAAYGNWTPLHDLSKNYRIPFHRLLGRCYDAEAVLQWLPSGPSLGASHVPDLNYGREGVETSRNHARETDERISQGRKWFWGDCRTESLDLNIVNGHEVARCDPNRDPKTWRKLIKVMEGVAGEEDKVALKHAAMAKRPLRGYQVNSMLAANVVDIETDTDADGNSDHAESSWRPTKRGILTSDGSRRGENPGFMEDWESPSLDKNNTPKRSRVEIVID